jgi:hypothetical protein
MLHKVPLMCVLAATLLAGSALAQAPMPNDVPDDVLLLVEFASIKTTLARVRQLAQKIDPDAAAQLDLVEPLLPAEMFKTNAAAAVDITKPVRVMVMAPPLHTTSAMVFTVTDAEAYLAGILGNKKGVVEGVHEYDGFAVTAVGKFGVIGETATVVKKVAGIVAKGVFDDKPLLSGDDICVAARVAGSLAALQKAGVQPFVMAKGALMLLAAKLSAVDDIWAATRKQRLLQAASYALVAAEKIARETESVSLSLRFAESTIEVTESWLPVKDSSVAKYMAATPASDFKTAKSLPGNSAAFALMRVGDPKPLIDWSAGLLIALGDADADPEAVAGVKAAFAKAAVVFDGEFARSIAFSKGAATLVTFVAGVKDAAGAKALIRDSAAFAARMSAIQPAGRAKVAVEITPDAGLHNKVGIDKVKLDITVPPRPGLPPHLAALPGTLIRRILGGPGFVAVREDAALLCIGKRAKVVINHAICGNSSLAGAGKVRGVFVGAEGKPVVVASADLTAVVNGLVDVVRTVQPDIPIPPTLKMGKSTPLTCFMIVAPDGVVATKLTIPHNVITSVRTMLKNTELPPAPAPGDENEFPAPPLPD